MWIPNFQTISIELLLFFIVIAIWELVWKGIALWNCGRRNQPVWFIFILIISSLGLLPIIYLLFFKKKMSGEKAVKKKR